MPDVFDQVSAIPTTDVFDQVAAAPPAPTASHSVWDTVKSAASRGLDGALVGIGLPPASDPSWHNPVRLSDVPSALNPWNLIKGIGQAGADQQAKVKQAFQNKDYMGVINHAIGAAVPTLAPAADAPDYVGKTGDVIGGIARSASNIGSNLLGAKFGGDDVLPETSTPSKPPLAPEPPSPAEANFQTSAKSIVQAINPSDAQVPHVVNAARTVLPELKAKEPLVGPITPESYPIAQQLAEAKYKSSFHDYLDPAIQRGNTIDGNTVADNKMSAIPDSWETDKPATYQSLKEQADQYRRPLALPEVYNRLQENNAELERYYKATPDQQYGMEVAGRPLAQIKAEGDALREGLYRSIDPDSNGANVAEIQNRRADLITFRQYMDKFQGKLFKQPTTNPLQRVMSGAGDIGEALLPPNPVGMYRVGKKLATAPPDISSTFSSAFKNFKGDHLPDVPGPSGPSVIGTDRQLTPGAIRLPGADNTSVNITTGKPLEQTFPINLTHPGPTPTFDWDRVLFPDWPERPVTPAPK